MHELLGHGSGKLLKENPDKTLNFDAKLINPLTNKPVETYYKEGQGYDSVFGTIGSAYEECRAESVGLYLCLEKEIARIFQIPEAEIDDAIYVNYVTLFLAGLKGLEHYNPTTKKWLQAHSNARFVILQVFLEQAKDTVKVEATENGKNLLLTVDKTKLNSVGKKVIGEFLLKLQIYKATADIANAKAMFDKYGEVSDEGSHPWATWRDVVIAHKKPRKIYVQSYTYLDSKYKVSWSSAANFWQINIDTCF